MPGSSPRPRPPVITEAAPRAGTLLRIGDSAVLEVTGLRTPCLQIDNFRHGLLKQVVGVRIAVPRRTLKTWAIRSTRTSWCTPPLSTGRGG